MLVGEVMTAPVLTVPLTSTVRQAIRLLYDQDITAAPVVDEAGRMVGIVSEMDLLRGEFEAGPRACLRPAALPDSPSAVGVEEVMSPNVRTVQENADILDVVDLMITLGMKSIPVVRDDTLVGIVSRHDLMGVVAHGDGRIRDDVLTALAELTGGTAAWRVTVHDGVVELQGGHMDDTTARIADVIARSVPGVSRVSHRP
ncbi:CBS domain-containing protein [Microbispora sp. ATCC PTA-5024]|uniref:CBS domain-containing protein n=1 Tax=Microbispora sp. ATCC PTA-5024 TaxID=316330 RepID=UPI0005633242|nr:CBS domain-containing protein [Microbispora sp. ATCC PTA-5024]